MKKNQYNRRKGALDRLLIQKEQLLNQLNLRFQMGVEMYDFAKEIFPYNRSITGNGVRKTLKK